MSEYESSYEGEQHWQELNTIEQLQQYILKLQAELEEAREEWRKEIEENSRLRTYISDLEYDRETQQILDDFNPNQGPR